MKLIVYTGGCRTPTCRFCVLPQYGRQGTQRPLATVVDDALRRNPEAQELALYNDGSILDTAEVSEAALDATADVIARHGVRAWWIESIPRFVYRDRLAALRARAGVERLVVGMGLQAVGDAWAVGLLGRPDIDALFERAIDEVHSAGAEARLYLLFGFGGEPEADPERVLFAVRWAAERGADAVSIGPYQPPIHAYPAPGTDTTPAWLGEAERILPGRVTLLSSENPSCGWPPRTADQSGSELANARRR